MSHKLMQRSFSEFKEMCFSSRVQTLSTIQSQKLKLPMRKILLQYILQSFFTLSMLQHFPLLNLN